MLGSLEFSLDSEVAGKYGQLLVANLHLLRLGITGGRSLERTFTPGELQWNNELVFRLVTIDMKTWLHNHFERLEKSGAPLDGDWLGRPDCEFILLGQQAERQAKNAGGCEKGLLAFHPAEFEFH